MARAAFGAAGYAILALVAVIVAALVLFLLTLGEGSSEIKLPLCAEASKAVQCWANNDGDVAVRYGDLSRVDPRVDEEPRRFTREQAAAELHTN